MFKLLVLFSIVATSLAFSAGGFTPVDVITADHLILAQWSVTKLAAMTNIVGDFSLTKINSLATQVVAGVNYKFNIEVNVNNQVKTCDVVVYERAWQNFRQVLSAACN